MMISKFEICRCLAGKLWKEGLQAGFVASEIGIPLKKKMVQQLNTIIFRIHGGFPAASGAFCNEAASNSTYLQHLGNHRYVGWQMLGGRSFSCKTSQKKTSTLADSPKMKNHRCSKGVPLPGGPPPWNTQSQKHPESLISSIKFGIICWEQREARSTRSIPRKHVKKIRYIAGFWKLNSWSPNFLIKTIKKTQCFCSQKSRRIFSTSETLPQQQKVGRGAPPRAKSHPAETLPERNASQSEKPPGTKKRPPAETPPERNAPQSEKPPRVKNPQERNAPRRKRPQNETPPQRKRPPGTKKRPPERKASLRKRPQNETPPRAKERNGPRRKRPQNETPPRAKNPQGTKRPQERNAPQSETPSGGNAPQS